MDITSTHSKRIACLVDYWLNNSNRKDMLELLEKKFRGVRQCSELNSVFPLEPSHLLIIDSTFHVTCQKGLQLNLLSHIGNVLLDYTIAQSNVLAPKLHPLVAIRYDDYY